MNRLQQESDYIYDVILDLERKGFSDWVILKHLVTHQYSYGQEATALAWRAYTYEKEEHPKSDHDLTLSKWTDHNIDQFITALDGVYRS